MNALARIGIKALTVLPTNLGWVIVKSPQYSQIDSMTHFAFNFKNSGWIFNTEKECWEIWMQQFGVIDYETWIFTTKEIRHGAHDIHFHNRANFEQAKIS